MKQREKVLYIFGGEQASGAEIVIESLMTKNVGNVEAYLFISPGQFAEKLLNSKKKYAIIPVPELKKLNRSTTNSFLFYFRAISVFFIVSYKTFRYLKENQIGTVHANTVVPASYLLPCLFFCKIIGRKIKWIWSDHDIKHFKKIDHFFSKICTRYFDNTLVVSNAVKAKYKSQNRVTVLYNGLDTEIFKLNIQARQSFRQLLGVSDDTIVFSIAGTICPRKQQRELIIAFLKVAENHQNLLLLIAGSFGSDYPDYTNEVQDLIKKQQEKIKYIGQVNNMIEFYNASEVLVNNSSSIGSEPLGTTIYEAMSCETIVMASKTGGSPEIIDHGINGFLFGADSENDLVEMLNFLVNNINLLSTIKKAAREKVKQKFAYQDMMNKYNEIILLNNNNN